MPGHHGGGMMHVAARESFAQSLQHRIGSALQGNPHAHEASLFHSRHQRIVKITGIHLQALEPCAVSDTGQGSADRHGMLQRRIEHAVHDLDIAQPGSCEAQHGIGYAGGVLQAAAVPLDLRVGAVDAVVLTAGLGLDRDRGHPGAIGRDIQPMVIVRRRADRRKPRWKETVQPKVALFDPGDTGQVSEAHLAEDAVEELWKDQLPVSDNRDAIRHQAQDLLRHDPERRPSQDYGDTGPAADRLHDTLQAVQEEQRVAHVYIVYVADRKGDYIGLPAGQGRLDISRGIPRKHQVQKKDGVSGLFRGLRDDAGADRHHGHGQVVAVRADQ